MDPGPYQLPRRNVEVYDSFSELVIAGFWQYGTLKWDEFHRYLTEFVVTDGTGWAIFRYDQREPGAKCPPSAHPVEPGRYVLLSNTGKVIRVGLNPIPPRSRNPTPPSTPARVSHYRNRGLARDGKCLITGLQTQMDGRLKVAHIFPRAHNEEWIREGYPSRITDTADDAAMGGPSKIDSVQNLITLRSDLHEAWVNYDFGVDPGNNYRITAFTNGSADVNGRYLELDHIQDRTSWPLDELFIDHFKQCILKHMKVTDELGWTGEDYDDGSFAMSNPGTWGTEERKAILEAVLANMFFDHYGAELETDRYHSNL